MTRKTCSQIIDMQSYLLGGYYHPRDEDGSPMDTTRPCSRYATNGEHCWQHTPRRTL